MLLCESQKESIFSLQESEMEKAQSICNIMVLSVLFTKRANTLNKVVTCGKWVFHNDMHLIVIDFNVGL